MTRLTPERIAGMIENMTTEAAVLAALRRNKIKLIQRPGRAFDYLIPCRKGMIRLYRTCSRSHPFAIRPVLPRTYPAPIHLQEVN